MIRIFGIELFPSEYEDDSKGLIVLSKYKAVRDE